MKQYVSITYPYYTLGVETPSQSRYVGYYEALKARDLQLPGPSPITLKEIRIRGLMYVGSGRGQDFWVNVDVGRGNQVLMQCREEVYMLSLQ